jgi:hypothetical protein
VADASRRLMRWWPIGECPATVRGGHRQVKDGVERM